LLFTFNLVARHLNLNPFRVVRRPLANICLLLKFSLALRECRFVGAGLLIRLHIPVTPHRGQLTILTDIFHRHTRQITKAVTGALGSSMKFPNSQELQRKKCTKKTHCFAFGYSLEMSDGDNDSTLYSTAQLCSAGNFDIFFRSVGIFYLEFISLA